MRWFLVRSQKIPVSENQKSISKVFLMMIRYFIKRNSVLSWFIQEFVFSLSKLWYGGEGDPIQLRILLGDIPLERLRGYSKVLLILLICTILRLRNLRFAFLIDGILSVRELDSLNSTSKLLLDVSTSVRERHSSILLVDMLEFF